MKNPWALALLSVVALFAVGLVALAFAWLHDPEPHIVVDRHVAHRWQETLAPAIHDLNSVGELPGLRADDAAQTYPCSIGSGELFDLSAGRSWTALVPGRSPEHAHTSMSPETARGFRALIRELTRSGWVVTGRETGLGMHLPDGLDYDTVLLDRNVGGTKLGMSVQADWEGAWADLGYVGAKEACHKAK